VWPKHAVAPHASPRHELPYRTRIFSHATAVGAAHCTMPSRLVRQAATLENLYLFHTILDKDDLYMKIVALAEIYNFLVLSFFSFKVVKVLKKI
jgi:hypothetical protein